MVVVVANAAVVVANAAVVVGVALVVVGVVGGEGGVPMVVVVVKISSSRSTCSGFPRVRRVRCLRAPSPTT